MKFAIKPASMSDFTSQIKSAIDKKMTEVLLGRDMNNVLFVESQRMTDHLKAQPAWKNLTGALRGQYGLTDEEVGNVKAVEAMLVNDPSITTIVKNGSVGGKKVVQLNWANFNALVSHPLTNHPLTRLNEAGQWELNYEVSWIDWLENGIVVHEHHFEKGGGRNSRSGQGTMVDDPGNVWVLPPTQIFQQLGFEYNPETLQKNVIIVLKKKFNSISKARRGR